MQNKQNNLFSAPTYLFLVTVDETLREKTISEDTSYVVQTSGFQGVVPAPAASASPGNMLEMPVLRPHPRTVEL